MRIGLVKIGEPVPGEGLRTRRMTRLAVLLAKAGHEVTWWTSDWSHQRKVKRPASLVEAARAHGFNLKMLPAPPYHRNISNARLTHHRAFARGLIKALEGTERPDLLWVCFPATPHTVALSDWAPAHNVRLIVDVRDLSPDVFVAAAPKGLRSIVHFLLSPLASRVGRALSRATGIVGVSQGYLDWAEALAKRAGRTPSRRAVFALGYEPPEISAERAHEIAAGPIARALSENGRLKAVFAGTFGSSYDLTTIIEAARLAETRGVAVDFVLAGGGEAAPAVERAAFEIGHLIYLGWLDAESLQVLLSRATFGLMAYVAGATQGLPNKVYEYMANGLVILNSLTGEAEELVVRSEAGMNYEAGSAEALLARVGQLIADEALRKRMSTASRRAFEAGLDSASEDKRILDFIESVAA